VPRESNQPPSAASALPPEDARAPAEPLTALLVGATGLVGRALLHELLVASEYAKVRALVRRPLEPHPKLEAHVVDFEKPSSWADVLEARHVFCALGTTLKKAGSEAAFRKIDLDLPLELLRRARERGATAAFVVSALGAEAASKVLYYRTKGELERGLKELGYPTLGVFRPSLLTGQRSESRTAERIGIAAAKAVSPLLVGGLRKLRPIAAKDVARAMVRVARTAIGSRDPLGFAIYESDALVELSAPTPRADTSPP
jgi:uncharacterized protein YbjT (DUF2867 family)